MAKICFLLLVTGGVCLFVTLKIPRNQDGRYHSLLLIAIRPRNSTIR